MRNIDVSLYDDKELREKFACDGDGDKVAMEKQIQIIFELLLEIRSKT